LGQILQSDGKSTAQLI